MSLQGKRVVIAGSRKLEEMSLLIEKQGGTPIIRSLQGTVFLAEKEVEPTLRKVVHSTIDVFIFTTGIGLETLLSMSEKLNLYQPFLDSIKNASVASRGYKTLSVLKKIGIKPVIVDEDGTTEGLIRAFGDFHLAGKTVAVQLHGDPSPRLIEFLTSKGATVIEVLPYQHIAPDLEVVSKTCKEIVAGNVDAVCFTTAIQVRSLFHFAKENNLADQLIDAFHDKVVAGAVGKVTAEALREEGVSHYVSPELERMGAMIIELVKYYKN